MGHCHEYLARTGRRIAFVDVWRLRAAFFFQRGGVAAQGPWIPCPLMRPVSVQFFCCRACASSSEGVRPSTDDGGTLSFVEPASREPRRVGGGSGGPCASGG